METTETTKLNQPATGPGNLLTEARLKLGLDPKNVAEMLHLREHQIRSLEADDYDNLPEPTYVKGYLRAYCQMLSLEPERIIKMYSDFITPPANESFEGIAPDKQAASNDDLVKMVTIGMVVVIVGLAIAFWMGEDDPEPATATVATVPAAPVAGETIGSPADVVAPAPEEDVAPAQVADQPAPVKPDEPKPAAQVAVSESPKPVLAVPSAEPAAAASGNTESVSLVPAIDDTNRTRLLVKVSESSWVDVRDARGNKLIYETVPAGREIPLEGLAPFSIFLGNANQVQVIVEDQPFDFSQFKRGLTARFKVSKQGNR